MPSSSTPVGSRMVVVQWISLHSTVVEAGASFEAVGLKCNACLPWSTAGRKTVAGGRTLMQSKDHGS